MKRTLVGSLKIAAAMARQKSTSRPVQLPCASGTPKPARPGVRAAGQEALLLDAVQRRLGGGARGGDARRERPKAIEAIAFFMS